MVHKTGTKISTKISSEKERRKQADLARRHPIDVAAGARLRAARRAKGMSQTELGNALPHKVKFQQIQKYETGANRISASRMWEIAQVLGVPMEYFFPEDAVVNKPSAASALYSEENIEMIRRMRRLPEQAQKSFMDILYRLG